MTCLVSPARALLFLICGAFLLGGCLPSAQSSLDEEKEYHFLAGKSRISGMDYKSAIDSFQKALEANPHSSAAHFELGWLFDQKESDPAAAIYHYSQYLKLRQNSEKDEMVKTRITACKQELARTVSLGPVTQTLQREFEQMAEENKRLREELEKWRAAYQAAAAQIQAEAAAQAIQAQTPTAPPVGSGSPAATAANPNPNPNGVVIAVMRDPARRPTTTQTSPVTRTHTVKPGETPTTIARKYGVKVDSLLRANPRMDPRRMRVGLTLTIPPA